MVTHLKHSEINKLKWDGCISSSICPLPYGLSWYLDVVSPGWEALVLDDYKAVMPLPFRTKFGVNYIFTPPFVQQLGVFGAANADVDDFIQAIPAKFSYVDTNLNEGNVTNGISNNNILLYLNNTFYDLYAGFADNTKRNIKKAERAGFIFQELISATEVISLFKANKGKDVAMDIAAYVLLEKLVEEAKQQNACTVWGVANATGTIVAGAVFISSFGRHVFLFSGNNADARQAGAMHFLIAEYIKQHAGTNTLLDFEGSNNASLARFYLSFGGYMVKYPKLKINRLPFPLNKLKV